MMVIKSLNNSTNIKNYYNAFLATFPVKPFDDESDCITKNNIKINHTTSLPFITLCYIRDDEEGLLYIDVYEDKVLVTNGEGEDYEIRVLDEQGNKLTTCIAQFYKACKTLS